MRLNDPRFIGFNGKPITGRVPPRLIVMNHVTPSSKQEAEIAHHYKLFCDIKHVSIAPFITASRKLSDGSLVRFDSLQGIDTAYAHLVPPNDATGKYALRPAFWYNPPQFSATGKQNIGTWTNMPFGGSAAPKRKENAWPTKTPFWMMEPHPGNRTWRDARKSSKTKGLVLSWWSPSPDRYGVGYARKAGTFGPQPEVDYNVLYLNGHIIASMDAPILGACLYEDGDQIKVAVATVSMVNEFTYGSGTYAYTIARYGSGGDSSGQNLTPLGTYDYMKDGQCNVGIYHAVLPDKALKYVFDFDLLTFDMIKFMQFGENYGFNDVNGAFWYWGSSSIPFFSLCHGIHFNNAGNEGVFPIYGYMYGASGSKQVCGYKINPQTGAITLIPYSDNFVAGKSGADMYADDAASFGADYVVGAYGPPHAWDYALTGPDTEQLVYVHLRYAENSTTQNAYFKHSLYGILRVIPRAGEGQPAGTDGYYGQWRMIGDLRAGVMFWEGWINASWAPVPSPWRVWHGFVKNTLIESGSASQEAVPLPGWEPSWVGHYGFGYEGWDTSFDGRMTVGRFNARTRLFVDGVDKTALLDPLDVANARYPVLCGPSLWRDGGHLNPKDLLKYVSGDAP